MARKPRFPVESETRPDSRRAKTATTRESGPAPKDARERSEAPTLPPPGTPQPRARPRRSPSDRASGVRTGEPDIAAATVDEVTADLSKDPRRERDEREGEED